MIRQILVVSVLALGVSIALAGFAQKIFQEAELLKSAPFPWQVLVFLGIVMVGVSFLVFILTRLRRPEKA